MKSPARRPAREKTADHRSFGAFDQGAVPVIACFNKAKTPLDLDFDKLIELVEMLVDPGISMMARGADPGTVYAYETADPVEETHFEVNGFPMSNFVYPAYFEYFRKPRSTKFDHLGLVKGPLQMLPGGYQLVIRNGRWDTLYASKKKEAKHASQDRRGRRGAARRHSEKEALKRSHRAKKAPA